MPIRTASDLLESFDLDALPVYEEGRFVGIVTDRDLDERSRHWGIRPEQAPLRELLSHINTWGIEEVESACLALAGGNPAE